MSKCCFGGFPILPTVKFLRECVCVCAHAYGGVGRTVGGSVGGGGDWSVCVGGWFSRWWGLSK